MVIFLATLLFGNSFLTSLIAFAALLALAAGVIAISLRYSMANYILLDERVDALEAISRSKAMMRGRKWHLFVLELSFIGWYLLVYLIVVVVVWIGMTVLGGIWFSGLGMAIPTGAFAGMIVVVLVAFLCAVPLLIWLQPYFTGAHAKFYDWSRQADQNSGVWEGRYDDHVPGTGVNCVARPGIVLPGLLHIDNRPAVPNLVHLRRGGTTGNAHGVDMSLGAHRLPSQSPRGVGDRAVQKIPLLNLLPVLLHAHVHGDGVDRLRPGATRVLQGRPDIV